MQLSIPGELLVYYIVGINEEVLDGCTEFTSRLLLISEDQVCTATVRSFGTCKSGLVFKPL